MTSPLPVSSSPTVKLTSIDLRGSLTYINVCLTHPKYVKAIKGKKTDKKDSKWIADLYKFDLVRCSFIPPKDFRQLRELSRYRFKLVCMKSSEKNRIQNCMTISNVGIASVLSDPFGKTATEIISYLLEHTADSMDEKAVRKLIKKGAKSKSDEIIEAIKGYTIDTDQVKKLELATVYKGNIIKNLIMDCQSYTKYRPNETTGGIFVSWRRKEELPTGA